MTKPEDKCEIWALDEERMTTTKKQLPSDETFTVLAETFSTLADSNRGKILYSLVEQELCACDIACVVGISESAVSHTFEYYEHCVWSSSGKKGE